jgi:hypothetical protein
MVRAAETPPRHHFVCRALKIVPVKVSGLATTVIIRGRLTRLTRIQTSRHITTVVLKIHLVVVGADEVPTRHDLIAVALGVVPVEVHGIPTAVIIETGCLGAARSQCHRNLATFVLDIVLGARWASEPPLRHHGRRRALDRVPI